MDGEKYLSAEEAAERMGIQLNTLYRRRSDGVPTPPAVKFGHKLRFRQSAVDEFMQRFEEPAVA